MQTSPLSNTLPVEGSRTDRSRQSADLAYPVLTVLSMILLLGSLWVF
ncbi:MAG: hypothetical protein P4K94_00190 [Terracidiphilus sp.]|nr:hypothetical protein [Terracidiphilus sp.]